MCGIGFFGPIQNPEKDKKLIIDLFKTLTKRGKDGFGFIVIGKRQFHYRHYDFKHILKILEQTRLHKGDCILLHCRARPISEMIHERSLIDQLDLLQPIIKDNIVVVFNGIIENDNEFKEDEIVWVDTLAICKHHSKFTDKPLKGSYSYIYVNLNEPDKIHVVKGNQPLYVYENPITKQLVISSEKIAFTNFYELEFPVATKMTVTIEQDNLLFGLLRKYYCNYSMSTIKLHNSVATPEPDENKAVVLCSGGLDSCVVAYEMAKQCNHIILLNFDYGQPANKQEWNATLKLYEYLQKKFPDKHFEVIQLKLSELSTIASSSTIFSDKVPEGISATETLSRWIPARNLIFLSYAIGYAEYCGAGKVAYGANLEESCVFPDNTTEAIEKLNKAVQWYIAKPGIQIVSPTAYDMKIDIVRKAIKYGVYDISWSCDKNGNKECGQCEGCTLKRKAYELL